MPLLTRDAILLANDATYETVNVPEWGGEVRVRSLTGAERDRFEQESFEGRGTKTRMNLINIRARLVSLTVVDETGRRLFSKKDIDVLGQRSAAALNHVFEVAQRLSGLSDDDVNELAENLDSDQTDSSSSVSP